MSTKEQLRQYVEDVLMCRTPHQYHLVNWPCGFKLEPLPEYERMAYKGEKQ